MKTFTLTKKYTLALGILFVLPYSVHAETKKDELTEKFPMFSSKSCQIKYKAEVSAILKLVDKPKAEKKIKELQTLRKEQDENIKNIFARIESKVDDDDKKSIVSDKKDDILKKIDDRRSKIDDLQNSIQISNKDVETIVRSTIAEQSTSTPTLCPINSDTEKDIRTTNKNKLKKLVEDKKDIYLNQTKEIQEAFLSDIKISLSDLTEELKK